MTMSCLHDQKLMLAPPSPEKCDATDVDKVFAQTLTHNTDDHCQHEHDQHDQQLASRSSSTGRKRSTSSSTSYLEETQWNPTAAELGALSLCDFDVLGVLGVGTYGVVKLARHIASGASVALKVLSKDHIVSLRQEKHILREREVHRTLDHPFIARLYGTFQDANCLYLALEYLPGGELWALVYGDVDNNDNSDSESERVVPTADDVSDDLPAKVKVAKDTEARDGALTAVDDSTVKTVPTPLTISISVTANADEQPVATSSSDSQRSPCRLLLSPSRRRRPQSPVHSHRRLDAKSRGLLRTANGGLAEDDAAFYLACLLVALDHLHSQHILYRDLKLENLVLDANGYPKVLDFGFAKPNATSAAGTSPVRNTTLCGSMDYMAPELLRHEPHDERVDLWSVGVIMYELLVGTTPFYHPNPREQGRRILSDDVTFPLAFEAANPVACDLVRRLLVKAPTERLANVHAIQQHAFFALRFPDATSWQALARREWPAPFAPKLNGPFDTSFFARMDDDQDVLDEYVEPFVDDGSDVFCGF